jgi:hypothetical protein
MQYYRDKTRKREHRYRDIDFSFEAHPHTGNLITKTDISSVAQSVRSLIKTSRFERLFQPTINSRVNHSLFELITPASMVQLRSNIKDVLVQHEPRINLIDVLVFENPNKNSLRVSILYLVKSSNQTAETEVTLERLR